MKQKRWLITLFFILVLFALVFTFGTDISILLSPNKAGVQTGETQNRAQLAQESSHFFDDFTVALADNKNIQSFEHVIWDGDSSYILEGDSGEIPVTDPGLFTLWHMNGDATDSIGDFHGALIGDVDCTVAAQLSQGCTFDGDEDYLSLGMIDVPASTSAITIAGWVYIDDLDGGTDIRFISKQSGGQESQHYWMLGESGNELRMRLKTESDTTTLVGGVLAEEQWLHVAGVYDGSFMRLYVNGQESASVPKTGFISLDGDVEATIGGTPSNNQWFDGILDEFAIWTRALSQTEIDHIYQQGIAGIAGNFISTNIPLSRGVSSGQSGPTIYTLQSEWEESDTGISMRVSTDTGNTWCTVNNGDLLDIESDCLPGSSLIYRVDFTSETSLDSARLSWSFDPPHACEDGTDNDGDGWVDLADPGCKDEHDNSEENADLGHCANGIDDDADGFVDGADAECGGWDDISGESACSNGLDDDGDTFIDWPDDPDCSDLSDDSEDPLPEFCGNGMIDEGEMCDVGHPYGGSGCSTTCQVEDGWTCPETTTDGLSVCTPVGKTTFYVDKHELGGFSCDDDGPGSKTQPWCNLAAIKWNPGPGDLIYVRAGVYAEELTVRPSGTSGNLITYKAYPGEEVVLTNSSDMGVDLKASDATNIRIEGFEVRKANRNGIHSGEGGRLEIVNNKITANDADAMHLCDVDILVEGNIVYDQIIGGNPHAAHHDGIQIAASCDLGDTLSIKHNVFTNNGQEFILNAQGTIYEYVEIIGNIMYKTESEYELFGGDPGSSYPKRKLMFMPMAGANELVIYGNTIANAKSGINPTGVYDSIIIKNNILYNSVLNVDDISNAETDYNIHFKSSEWFHPDVPELITWGGVEYTSLAAFQSATGQGQNSIEADPAFFDSDFFAFDHDYHLLPTSPARDSADPLTASVFDLPTPWYDLLDSEMRPLPAGGLYDIGADEFSTSTLIEPCQLTSASWSATEASVGDIVSLTVEGTSCDGKEIKFIVWEDDEGLDEESEPDGDEFAGTMPDTAFFVDNTATTTWIVESNAHELSSPGEWEWFFVAQLEDYIFEGIKSDYLIAS